MMRSSEMPGGSMLPLLVLPPYQIARKALFTTLTP